MFRTIRCLSILAFATTACAAATEGAKPHDMSAEEHEREAQTHSRAAEAHASQYRPEATVERRRCSPRGDPSGTEVDRACWTSIRNPTENHATLAAQHRKHAADHRRASAALRDAEARACVGIPPDDRDMSPFEHIEDISRVERLMERTDASNAASQRTAGVIVTFAAVPGMSADWLQRVVDCHLARNASLGHQVPEMPNCPLVPNRVEAHVTATGSEVAVAIRSNDSEAVRQILARAERLSGRPTPQAESK